MSVRTSIASAEFIEKHDVLGSGKVLFPVLMSLFIFAVGLAGLFAPPKTGEMAVVFPPGQEESVLIASIVAAGGGFVSSSRLPNVVVAFAYDEEFSERILAKGAFMLLAATGLCAPVVLNEE